MAKYYYNGVLLPTPPLDTMLEYPYCWIRDNSNSGYYDLIMSKTQWYKKTAGGLDTSSRENGVKWYRIQKSVADSAENWIFKETNTNVFAVDNSDRRILWSNDFIPDGSMESIDIYFEPTDPISEDGAHTHDYIEGVNTQKSCTENALQPFVCECGKVYFEPIHATLHNFENDICNVCGAGAPYYYNGILLPKIPMDDTYQYHCIIMYGDSYKLIATKYPLYVQYSTFRGLTLCTKNVTSENYMSEFVAYFSATDYWEENTYEYRNALGVIPDILWTDYCIPFGSYESSVIYYDADETPIPKDDCTHNYTEQITIEPTCGTDGLKTFICECGDTYTEIIPATRNHNYVRGVCTICGNIDRVSIDYDMVKQYANEARRLTGTTKEMHTDEILTSFQNVEIDDMYYSEIIKREIKSISNDSIEKIGSYAFAYCTDLISANFPNCSVIGTGAFIGCANLTSINSPMCTAVYEAAFKSCINLTSISFPMCTTVGWNAFAGCSDLTSISFPMCTTVGWSAFKECSNLTTVNLPRCSNVQSGAFYSCSNLTTVNLPRCNVIQNSAFSKCVGLTSVNISNCNIIFYGAFYSCTNLKSVNLQRCSYIYNYAFAGCYNLSVILLNTPCVCYLENLNAFSSTPFTGYSSSFSGHPYIFVPASLIDSYKIASYWTYFSKNFTTIEDYNPICIINNDYLLFSTSKNITVSFNHILNIPSSHSIEVISNKPSVISISDVKSSLDYVSFDVITHEIEETVTITINANFDDKIYSRSFDIIVMKDLPTPEISVENLDTTYGFTLNDSGYYESNNKGVDNSYAICKLNILSDGNVSLYLDCINNAESGYDYGILSTLDSELIFSSSPDSNNVFKLFSNSNSQDVQTIDYGVIPFGWHFIYIKYRKDSSSSSANDSLQFKARLE